MSELSVSVLIAPERKKDMTRAEEEINYTRFVMGQQVERYCILTAFEGRAHKAVKMGSFEEYCKNRFGLSYDATYLSKLVKAAKLERAILRKEKADLGEDPRSCNALQLLESEKPKITLRAALQISSLPEDKWIPVYEEYLKRDPEGPKTPKELATQLGKIVKREMVGVGKPQAPRRKPDLTPIVAEKYDGSEEQKQSDDTEHEARTEVYLGGVAPGDFAPISGKAERADVLISIPLQEYGLLKSFVRSFIAGWEDGNKSGLEELYAQVKSYLGESEESSDTEAQAVPA